jgi:hypothetical protein
MDVRTLLIAHAQAAKLIQPSESPFDYPAPVPEPAAMLGVAFRRKRDDASIMQALPD